MRNKDSGFVQKLLPVLLSTGMVFGLILFSGQLMEALRTREEANQIARAYLLQMETEGYLTDAAAKELARSLEEACGLTEIDLSGSSRLKAAYGEMIQLVIRGKMEVDLQARFPFFYVKDTRWTIPVEVNLYSTAKH